MSFATDFSLLMLTSDPVVAALGDRAGIDHIGLDFETLGKRERQPDLKEWVSTHKVTDIPPVRKALTRAKLFSRTEPLNPKIERQIETLLDYGVQSLMLPMFTSAADVAKFVDFVAGRAYVSLLLETPQAVVRISDIVQVQGIDEISIGLNDLHRSFGLTSHFELLVSDMMRMLSETVTAAGIRFGFGTLGRVRDTGLPIPSDLIYAQYPRLNGRSARIFRFFLGPNPRELDFDLEIRLLRERLDYWNDQTPEAWEEARQDLAKLFRN